MTERSCPKCGSSESYKYKCRAVFICKACSHHFSETSKTLLHSRKMPLEKYKVAFEAFRNGETSTAVAALINCDYKTAWRLRRIAIRSFEESRGNASLAS